ncbi:hypothetical protein ACHHYP_15913 [Achlya hypogyna]|uniref:Polycystin cation channel PKD1/PKD2 domain-containing protein n=1 Tax=Achlya hypogyna TaxID=1202772 RepID=A0A1V9YA09_ACHHY|nr:hypothetical protein ACHHYP_15913 [Achlya hypogyna]
MDPLERTESLPASDTFDLYRFNVLLKMGKLREAVAELDKSIGHEEQIRRVYGETQLKETPLYGILEGQLTVPRGDAHELLEHVVMRTVIQMKWEAFGLRMYLDQLLMYALLLLTMTLSVSMDASGGPTASFHTQIFVWAVVVASILIGLVAVRFFRYKHKDAWFVCTGVVVAVAAAALSAFIDALVAAVSWETFFFSNNVCLLIAGIYFLQFELAELFGEVADETRELSLPCVALPRPVARGLFWLLVAPVAVVHQFLLMLLGRERATYYQSYFNKIQMPTFFVVVGYSVAQIYAGPVGADRLLLGTVLTFLLWALSVQYLEVHGTAGYLIPMMRAMMYDVKQFLAFYLPFQCAYALAYYLLFQGSEVATDADEATGYATLVDSFLTTFLVMLQQISTEPFDALKSDSARALGYTLLLTHSTLVMVMLLNVLIAMMSQSVEARMEKAKREALVSFAECVLRSEKTQGLVPLPERTHARGLSSMHIQYSTLDGYEPELFGAAEEKRLGFRPDDQSTEERLDELKAQIQKLQDTAFCAKEFDKCVRQQQWNKATKMIQRLEAHNIDLLEGENLPLMDRPIVHIQRRPELKALLGHAVVKSLLTKKWQNFGFRMYLQQLFAYGLLLMTLTLSVSMDATPVATYEAQLGVWLTVGVGLVVLLFATFFFKYETKNCWTATTVVAVALAISGGLVARKALAADANWAAFVLCNNIALAIVGAYFVWFEVTELYGETTVPQDAHALYKYVVRPAEGVAEFLLMLMGRPQSHYFQSDFNKLQSPTFAAILLYMILETLSPGSHTIHTYLGTPVTFISWALSVQYLEVHNTAGYLIPMMHAMLHDVHRFLAFYLPFQCAYTFAYFLLFQSYNEPTYATISQAFATTFLVMLGQINLDPFESLPTTGEYVLGYALLLTHATLVIVMLLNVLVAMMNKTMDDTMEKAHIEAQASFAECILRSEKVLAPPMRMDTIADQGTSHMVSPIIIGDGRVVYPDTPPEPTAEELWKSRLQGQLLELKKQNDDLKQQSHDMSLILGNDTTPLRNTVLFLALAKDELKPLFRHQVMIDVAKHKWADFGMRSYMQQVIVYSLLLMTLTLAVSMDLSPGPTDVFRMQLSVWLNAGVALVIALIATHKFGYATKKKWAWTTALVIVVALVVLNYTKEAIMARVNWPLFVHCNSTVLVVVALFFVWFEVTELMSEAGERSPGESVVGYYLMLGLSAVGQFATMLVGQHQALYFNSLFNKLQLPTFVGIVVFVVVETFSNFSDDVRLYLGTALSFLTWAMSVQYLEVHDTAGYLLPMMRMMLHDVYRFFAFYLPFQCAYAFAYFLLFQNTDETTYNTVVSAFVTTFLVMLGQINLDAFNDLPTPSYVLGYILLLSHATLVIVMLLNVLIAIMNKTMDNTIEKAKREARVSFSECILRSEKIMRTTCRNTSHAQNIEELELIAPGVLNLAPDADDTTELDEEPPMSSEDAALAQMEAVRADVARLLQLLNARHKKMAATTPHVATPARTHAFDLVAFEKAITGKKIKLAAAEHELDKALDDDDELRWVYGVPGETGLNETPLFLILQSPQYKNRDAAKQLLEHPVMRKVVMLKWKIFGLRMYMEQALMYCLLLMTLTLSVSMDATDAPTDSFPTQLAVWLSIGTALALTLLSTFFFFAYERRACWAVGTGGVVGATLLGLHQLTPALAAATSWPWFVFANNVVLAAVALYFLRFELNEMFGELSESHREWDCGVENLDYRVKKALYYLVFAPFMVIAQFVLMVAGHVEANYYQSDFNKVQLPTFVTLVVYAITELVAPMPDASRLYVGVSLTFLMWALSVQYLEVHGTAGYLIPMMKRMLHDVYRFLAFYLPFQCAYGFAYYLLFQGYDEPTYATISHAFVTTFLVMLGQINLDPFENLPTTGEYVLGYALLLTHATLVIVMLLNVLVAMMTKSVDGGMEKAKREALVSFAECVLRSEKTTGLMVLPRHALRKRKLTEIDPLVDGVPPNVYLESPAEREIEDDGLGFKPDDKSSDELVDELTQHVQALEAKIVQMEHDRKRDMEEVLLLLRAQARTQH